MFFLNRLIERLFRPDNIAAAARRAGYVSDQLGIGRRYAREHDGWQPHLDNTRRFIVNAAACAANHRSAVVLGSGWLLDVPIEQLASMFVDVWLVDIVHPQPVQAKVLHMPNVHLLTVDLTGGAVLQAECAGSLSQFVDWLPTAHLGINLDDYDFVVSVNLLNQLDILLCDYLSSRFSATTRQLEPVRRMVQQHHINSLPCGKSCLITDYEQVDISVVDGTSASRQLIYCSLPVGAAAAEWLWHFDTNQRYSVKNNTIFKVKAYCF